MSVAEPSDARWPMSWPGRATVTSRSWSRASWPGRPQDRPPEVTEAEVREVFRGFPAFSPDGRFIVGPVPGVRGLVMAAACNAHGVSGSAGLAGHVLESLQPGPSPYVRSLSPGRYYPGTWDWESARTQAQGIYQNYYSLPPQLPRAGDDRRRGLSQS